MDFQWFEHVTWDSIKDLRGTTYVQPPTSFRFVLHPSSHHSQQPHLIDVRVSLESAGAQQLARPAVNASESALLELFWAEDWSALGTKRPAEWDVAPVQNTTRGRTNSKCNHVFVKLLHWHVMVKKGASLSSCQKRSTSPSHGAGCSTRLTQKPQLLPRVSCRAYSHRKWLSTFLPLPGPLGMRAEHWYDFGSLTGNSDLFVQVVAHIAAAVANSVLQYLKPVQITPLGKPTGGHKPLPMMSFLRKLELKSVMAAKIESVAKCAGPLQCRWSKTMIKTIQYLTETDNSRVLVALVLKAACQHVSRSAMVCIIAQTDADLATLFSSGAPAPQSTGCIAIPPTS